MVGTSAVTMVLALVGLAAGTPQIVSSEVKIVENCMTISKDKYCFFAAAYSTTFDEELYVCNITGSPNDMNCQTDGSIERIDRLPPEDPNYGTYAQNPGFLFPLHIATAGAFRLECTEPNYAGMGSFVPHWELGGNPAVAPA